MQACPATEYCAWTSQLFTGNGKIQIFHVFCQTPDLGQGLEFDFTFPNNKNNNDKKNNDKNNNNPHPNFPGWDGTRGLKFGTQTY